MPLPSKSTEPMRPDVESAAYKAGLARFAALKPGDKFLGASPEADAAGYTDHGDRFDFMAGYLRHLKQVTTDRRETNIIVKLERKS
jgi:hypothetical protein